MRILFIIAVLFSSTVSAQLTKNIKSFTSDSGITIEEGSKITFVDSGEAAKLVFYGRKSMPIPTSYFNSKEAGKTFTVEKVMMLKGTAKDEGSVIVKFSNGKKKCYAFVYRAIDAGEIKV